MNNSDISRIIEMAWEDRTPFEGIYKSYKISEKHVIKIMRSNLRRKSFIMWRKRVRSRKTKHSVLNSIKYLRHQSKIHNKHR
ncbi:TIGR03643 family protein [bacterium]|nr:TIGR03643 family protein [bacterium]